MQKQLVQIIIGSSILGMSLLGCATTPTSMSPSSSTSSPPGRVQEENKNVSVFDRIPFASDWQVQDFRKGHSVTYSKVHLSPGSSLSNDQRQIVIIEGSPDLERHFRNHLGNHIDEWLYEKKDYQIQFRDGQLVYCDAINQQAKFVLENGQPSEVFTREQSGGQQNEFFWYQPRNKMGVFVNGKLIVTQ